jgi:CPA2 family monovalent cation:H+ antiporter-2
MVLGIFNQLLVVLVVTIGVVAACRRLSFPPIVGYIIVGLLISLIGHASFQHFSKLTVLARYGVVFLLFSIGLDFSLPRLISMKKMVFGLGSLQMLACGGLSYVLCLLLHLDGLTSFVVAIAVAMSSTAIVSKILKENGQTGSHVGHLTMSMLIFQDLMVVPAIIITTFFATHTGGSILSSLLVELLKGIFTFAVLVLVGKRIFTPIFHEVARSRSAELFTLATLFVVLSAAYFSDLMGMSTEFGAFLAGAILGGTPYHHQVESNIRPFRDVLLGLFFIGIGTLLNIDVFVAYFTWIIAAALIIFVVKFLIVAALVKHLKLGDQREAVKVGLLLAQAGEFGFVLVALASEFDFLGDMQAQIILASLIVSMLFSMLSLRFQDKLIPLLMRLLFGRCKMVPDALQNIQLTPGVILIVGFSRIGQWVAKAISTQGHDYLALDLDPTIVNQARLAGENVVYADAADTHILQNLCIEQAKAIVLTFEDSALSLKVLQQMRLCNQTVPILVRTHDDIDMEALLAAGATEVIPDALEASLILSMHILSNLGMDKTNVMIWGNELRQDRYKLLKGYFVGEDLSADPDAPRQQQRAILIQEGCFAEGKTIFHLDIHQFGVEVIAMRKNGIVGSKPAHQTKVHAGDVLIVAGFLDNLDRFEIHIVEGR